MTNTNCDYKCSASVAPALTDFIGFRRWPRMRSKCCGSAARKQIEVWLFCAIKRRQLHVWRQTLCNNPNNLYCSATHKLRHFRGLSWRRAKVETIPSPPPCKGKAVIGSDSAALHMPQLKQSMCRHRSAVIFRAWKTRKASGVVASVAWKVVAVALWSHKCMNAINVALWNPKSINATGFCKSNVF